MPTEGSSRRVMDEEDQLMSLYVASYCCLDLTYSCRMLVLQFLVSLNLSRHLSFPFPPFSRSQLWQQTSQPRPPRWRRHGGCAVLLMHYSFYLSLYIPHRGCVVAFQTWLRETQTWMTLQFSHECRHVTSSLSWFRGHGVVRYHTAAAL